MLRYLYRSGCSRLVRNAFRYQSTREQAEALSSIPAEKIRNFAIIAHIDHGKTTLSSQLLYQTSTIKQLDGLYTDKLAVERERGITVKATTASMVYKGHLLNLIDTPGHVDFSSEVLRSLRACEGVVLVVDACSGLQAQTFANLFHAMELGLAVIPTINKVDLGNARTEEIADDLQREFGFVKSQTLRVSGKTGEGIPALLDAIIERIPAPKVDRTKPLRAFLFDAWVDAFRGIVALVRVEAGILKQNTTLTGYHSKTIADAQELGIMWPELVPTKTLAAGQVGYLITGLRNREELPLGETLSVPGEPVEPFPGFAVVKPVVYAGFYPYSSTELDDLSQAIEKLAINDMAVTYAKESSLSLGIGFRCGFLGLLHMDVFRQRIEDDYGVDIIATWPTVPYRIQINGQEKEVTQAHEWGEGRQVEKTLEPFVLATITMPSTHLSNVLGLCFDRRGVQTGLDYLTSATADTRWVQLRFELPLAEIVIDFHDRLKDVTSGYASFDYIDIGFKPSKLVVVTILLNGTAVPELTFVSHESKAERRGRDMTKRLKEVLPRQQFQIAIQAAIGSRIIARETLSAYRKDVTAKLYGGDVTRKMKLLNKQKEGKKRMRELGGVQVGHNTLVKLLTGKGGSDD